MRQVRGGRKIGWGRTLLTILAAFVVIGAGVGYYLYRQVSPHAVTDTVLANNPPAFRNRITILLLGNALSIINGKDQTNPYVRDRTDTMMLVSINPQTYQASVLSIPRDTLVKIPGVGLTKINEANYFGGPKLAVKLVEETLHVPVDYYMETTMWNFVKIINSLGGLTVDVTQPMNYGGYGNPLDIHLKPGVQTLNGYQVLAYVRFRHEPLGDISRIQQQQYIVKLILKKVLTPSQIWKLPEIIRELSKDIVYTNLSLRQEIALGLMAAHVNQSQIRYATLAGYPVQRMDPYMHQMLDYWIVNQRLMHLMVDEIVLERPLTAADRRSVHIVVRAGTLSMAPALQLAQWLRQRGFTVNEVIWANHHNHVQNEILDFTGDKYLVARMANALGPLNDTAITESPYHDVPGLDMEITVGSDFHLNPAARP
ncbi:cell envelope-related transcriptional attenuator [Sulfobacillus acidophilus TPY]|uniref:Cell envelope-related transcriptional attenuator n=1 Tax=Sulfobacillus acidophilus (strain ATCC 700253 / DSM 10332 / NAL) TaxID=679936 RepID=G8TVD5_SULAD|nr:cell envelope-related transcriptional attenuator [Sulfobacillus acidophilus TPY]AEW05854.1 cell envelope-related transcriptional attenuator [Sulfobacillus acidophilus DSM 10332]